MEVIGKLIFDIDFTKKVMKKVNNRNTKRSLNFNQNRISNLQIKLLKILKKALEQIKELLTFHKISFVKKPPIGS